MLTVKLNMFFAQDAISLDFLTVLFSIIWIQLSTSQSEPPSVTLFLNLFHSTSHHLKLYFFICSYKLHEGKVLSAFFVSPVETPILGHI